MLTSALPIFVTGLMRMHNENVFVLYFCSQLFQLSKIKIFFICLEYASSWQFDEIKAVVHR